MSADMGGTQIASALDQVFRTRDQQIPASLFLLTDGEVRIFICFFWYLGRDLTQYIWNA